MAGLCEGGNEPPGSLKATVDDKAFNVCYYISRASYKLCSEPATIEFNGQHGNRKTPPMTNINLDKRLATEKEDCWDTSQTRIGITFEMLANKKTNAREVMKTRRVIANNRHHRVRGAIACLLRNKGWEVHEEVYSISEDDSHRRADIIAINRQQQKAIIIDPTIRMERDLNQAHQVDQEKRAIYEP
ncbi:hypothetical protein ANN_11789 [Periplaneta americana]|uniref:Uncharacterized protein n=1 Tax=Periplaneta americana TaxID=6978 RepID=A0ABQ8T617_PERAM|nr:hypothetical protein ANN_11789 [Periplaneta americana]